MKVQIVVSFYHQVSGVLLTRVAFFFLIIIYFIYGFFFAMTYSVSTYMLHHVYVALQELMLNSCKVLYLYYISYVN